MSLMLLNRYVYHGTKKSKQQRKQLSKAIAAAQAAENRQPWWLKSDSKQQPAPKPDARVLQRQLYRGHVRGAAAACR